MTYKNKNSGSNNSKAVIDIQEYKLGQVENQLRTKLIENDEETIGQILKRLKNVNINKLSHEVTETIRIRNSFSRVS